MAGVHPVHVNLHTEAERERAAGHGVLVGGFGLGPRSVSRAGRRKFILFHRTNLQFHQRHPSGRNGRSWRWVLELSRQLSRLKDHDDVWFGHTPSFRVGRYHRILPLSWYNHTAVLSVVHLTFSLFKDIWTPGCVSHCATVSAWSHQHHLIHLYIKGLKRMLILENPLPITACFQSVLFCLYHSNLLMIAVLKFNCYNN